MFRSFSIVIIIFLFAICNLPINGQNDGIIWHRSKITGESSVNLVQTMMNRWLQKVKQFNS